MFGFPCFQQSQTFLLEKASYTKFPWEILRQIASPRQKSLFFKKSRLTRTWKKTAKKSDRISARLLRHVAYQSHHWNCSSGPNALIGVFDVAFHYRTIAYVRVGWYSFDKTFKMDFVEIAMAVWLSESPDLKEGLSKAKQYDSASVLNSVWMELVEVLQIHNTMTSADRTTSCDWKSDQTRKKPWIARSVSNRMSLQVTIHTPVASQVQPQYTKHQSTTMFWRISCTDHQICKDHSILITATSVNYGIITIDPTEPTVTVMF